MRSEICISESIHHRHLDFRRSRMYLHCGMCRTPSYEVVKIDFCAADYLNQVNRLVPSFMTSYPNCVLGSSSADVRLGLAVSFLT